MPGKRPAECVLRGVVHFRAASGNTTDDRTHVDTWKLLCELAGRSDFLYVTDSKLATAENMAYPHQHRGRFITVLPRTRGEDKDLRQSLREGKVSWRTIYEKIDDEDEKKKVLDRFSTTSEPVTSEPVTSAEGYEPADPEKWYLPEVAKRTFAFQVGLTHGVRPSPSVFKSIDTTTLLPSFSDNPRNMFLSRRTASSISRRRYFPEGSPVIDG